MKFRRKEGSVEVGLLAPVIDDRFPSMHPPEPKAALLNEIGRAFTISIALLESEYEPADEDAKAWLSGVRERIATPPPPPYPPYEPADLEMEFQIDPDSPPQKVRMGASKKRQPVAPPPGYRFDLDKLPKERPEWWPPLFPWPPPNAV